MADPRPPADPVLDLRVRWRLGRVLLWAAGLLTLVALVRPLAPWSPGWLKASDALLIGLGVTASALLASLRGRKLPETLALHGFLVLSVDALGQVVGAHGFPVWPFMVLLVAALSVAEGLPADSVAAQGHLTGRHHLAFQAQDRAMVDAFYKAALAHGGKDNGAPGERAYHPGYYAAFVLDPDGNNIEAVFHGDAQRSAASVKITF